jgi:hypothetical protein
MKFSSLFSDILEQVSIDITQLTSNHILLQSILWFYFDYLLLSG